jgi:hypothetical protein
MTEPLIAYALSNFRAILLGCDERSGALIIVDAGHATSGKERADVAR